MIGNEVLAGTSALLVGLAWMAFVVVACRNIVSLIQLIVASWVFASRTRPSPRTNDLWIRSEATTLPVTVVAPAYNEELSIVDSVTALLALQYPDHEVIVVSDGSTDGTMQRLTDAFALKRIERSQLAVLQRTEIRGVYTSSAHPKLLVVDKENGRKADAVNAGIGFARRPLVCVIDADSIIESDGLLRAAEPFVADDGKLVAVGGAIRVVNGSSVRGGYIERLGLSPHWLPRFQVIEYLRAFLTARVANADMGMLLLISGAFGVFRRSVLVEIGGYRHDTVGEDLEIVVRLHRRMREMNAAYRMEFIPEVVCWTEAPESLAGLRNQRSRWQQGAIETVVRHRRMLFNPAYGRIGMIALPLLVVEDIIGPPVELIGYLIVPACALLGLLSVKALLAFLCLTLAFGTGISVGSLVLEEKQLRRVPNVGSLVRIAAAAVIENFGYRQANLAFRLRGCWAYAKRERGWAAVSRRGFDRANPLKPLSTGPAGDPRLR